MKRRYIMAGVILFLCCLIVILHFKNRVNVPDDANLGNNIISSQSIVKNTTTTLRANNNSFNYINQMLEKIKFKYLVLNIQDSETNIGSDVEKIEKQIQDNKILIENDTDTYENVVTSLQEIDNSINLAFYNLGIELIDGEFKSTTVKVEAVEDDLITCTNSDGTYDFLLSDLPFEATYNVGDELKIYYSDLIFEDNVGKFSIFYIEII